MASDRPLEGRSASERLSQALADEALPSDYLEAATVWERLANTEAKDDAEAATWRRWAAEDREVGNMLAKARAEAGTAVGG